MPYGNLLADVVQGSTANTPPVFKDGNGTAIGTLCRAWVNFNGTGTVAIRASFNVSSITDNGTGDYTVNFTNAMPDADYAVCTASQSPTASIHNILAGNSNVAGTITASNQTASNIRIVGFTSTYSDSAFNHISIFR
jgi:hypothetical protein